MKFEYRDFIYNILRESSESPKTLLKTFVSVKRFQQVEYFARYYGVPRSAVLRVMVEFFIKKFEKDFKEAEEWYTNQQKSQKYRLK